MIPRRTIPIADCRAAPWHFDGPEVAKAAHGHVPAEIALQALIVRNLPLLIPCMIAAVPNGTYTASRAARGRAKTEGACAGYPDLIIDGIGPNAGRVCRAEIKTGSTVSPEQFDKLGALHAAGHLCGVFRSLDTLSRFLMRHGWVSRERGA